MKLKSFLLPVLAVVSLFVACDMVHEFPVPGKEIDPTEIETSIKIDCKVQLTGYNVVSKGSEFSSDDIAGFDRRYIVTIRSDESIDTLVESHIITRDVVDTSSLIIETKLQARKYKLVVWMDYVKKGTQTDLFYNTSNGAALNRIHQPAPDKYVAGSVFKDAQTFVSDLDLTPYAGQWYADVVVPAPLYRPVAKITVLANDLAEYASSIGYHGSLSDFAEQISIEFSYDGYYPTGFNAHTGKLNDSEVGYGFNSMGSYPYSFEKKDFTRIGFDYVFVNGESSSVTVSVKIKSQSGQLINLVDNIVIPVKRGEETVVFYKFFTKEYVPGIGINPGFDGEFDVYV